ncbi:MAG: response regulator transcription factor [Clostridia bacterium]|nr:response regulator transcription factor [Clostridia bacterium]
MIRIAICEDDKKCQEKLISHIHRFEKEEGKTATITVFEDGMNFVSDYRPVYDIVFMDIEMPYLNGMVAAKKLRTLDKSVALVFVTHLAQYAVQGYEVEAVGYLLKPLEYFAFHRQMTKILSKESFKKGEELFVKTVTGLVKIDTEQLMYVEIMEHYLLYHTVHDNYRAYGKLSDLEEKLPSPQFFRCNKSYIVNFNFVGKLSKTSLWVEGEEIMVSRSRQKPLIEEFNRYLGGTIHG